MLLFYINITVEFGLRVRLVGYAEDSAKLDLYKKENNNVNRRDWSVADGLL